MDSKVFFSEVLTLSGGCFKHISNDQLSVSTPCSEWNLEALINHMVGELLWLSQLLGGKSIKDVGRSLDGDLLGEDFQKSWLDGCQNATKTVSSANLDAKVVLSYGEVTMRHYLNEVSCDLLIHGWDVAQSINCSLIIPVELAQFAYNFYKPQEKKLKASGQFGAKIEVDENSSLQTKLLAVVGRVG